MNGGCRVSRGTRSDGTMSTDGGTDCTTSPTRGGMMVMSFTGGGLRSRSVLGGRVPSYAMPTVSSRIRVSLSTDKLPEVGVYTCCQRFKPLSPPPLMFIKVKRRRSRSTDTRLTDTRMTPSTRKFNYESSTPAARVDSSATKKPSGSTQPRGRSSSRSVEMNQSRSGPLRQDPPKSGISGPHESRTGAGTQRSRGGSGSVTPSGPPTTGQHWNQPRKPRGHSTGSFTLRKPLPKSTENSKFSTLNGSSVSSTKCPSTRSFTSKVRTPSEENYSLVGKPAKTMDRKLNTGSTGNRSFEVGKSHAKHEVTAHGGTSPRVNYSGSSDVSAGESRGNRKPASSMTSNSTPKDPASTMSSHRNNIQAKSSSQPLTKSTAIKSSVGNGLVVKATEKSKEPVNKSNASVTKTPVGKPHVSSVKPVNDNNQGNISHIIKKRVNGKASEAVVKEAVNDIKPNVGSTMEREINKESSTTTTDSDVSKNNSTTNEQPISSNLAQSDSPIVSSTTSDMVTSSIGPSGAAAGAAKSGAKPDPEADEYRAKLAEKRRLAREKAEKEAEEKKAEVERCRREEEDRIQREQEEEARREAEELRQVEEARAAEQERYRVMVEAEEKRKKEEAERLEAEQRQRIEKERIAKEEAEKLEVERQARMKREEEEKNERKKRLESIMKRVKGDETPTKTNKQLLTPSDNSPSESGENSIASALATDGTTSDIVSSAEPAVREPLMVLQSGDVAQLRDVSNDVLTGVLGEQQHLTGETELVQNASIVDPVQVMLTSEALSDGDLLNVNNPTGETQLPAASSHEGLLNVNNSADQNQLIASDLMDFGFSPKRLIHQSSKPEMNEEGPATGDLLNLKYSSEGLASVADANIGSLIDMGEVEESRKSINQSARLGPCNSLNTGEARPLDGLNNELIQVGITGSVELNGNIDSEQVAANGDINVNKSENNMKAEDAICGITSSAPVGTNNSPAVATIASLLAPLDSEEKTEVKFKSPLLQQILGRRNRAGNGCSTPEQNNKNATEGVAQQ